MNQSYLGSVREKTLAFYVRKMEVGRVPHRGTLDCRSLRSNVLMFAVRERVPCKFNPSAPLRAATFHKASRRPRLPTSPLIDDDPK